MALRKPSRVYKGLAEPLLIAGVEPRLLLLNVGFFFFALVMFKLGWWIVGGLIVVWLVHQALKAISKTDPFVRKIYLLYQRQADRYEPFPESNPRRGHRPSDIGRGVIG